MANTSTATTEREFYSSVQFLTVTAIFVALTYIFTAFINVRLPIAANGGLIHLGNVPLFIGAILFGKTSELQMVRDRHCSSMCHQSGWLLYCRNRNLRKLFFTGRFHSGKSGTDRCSCCDRSYCDRPIKCSSKENRIKKIKQKGFDFYV